MSGGEGWGKKIEKRERKESGCSRKGLGRCGSKPPSPSLIFEPLFYEGNEWEGKLIAWSASGYLMTSEGPGGAGIEKQVGAQIVVFQM